MAGAPYANHAALKVDVVPLKTRGLAGPHASPDHYAYTRALIATPERFARLQRFFRWQLDPEHNRLTMDAVEGLRRFDRPTLLLWGRQDTNFGPHIAERLAGDIPGVVGVEYLEHSAHMPFQEEPDRYANAVRQFLGADAAALDARRRAFQASRDNSATRGARR